MKFKIDENLPLEFADILRRADHDTETVLDQGLQGRHDPVIASTCQKEERILVTLDRSFSDVRAYPPDQYPGIIVLSLTRHSKAHLIEVLRRAIPLLESHPVQNCLWILEEHRLRIRQASE